MRSDAGRHPDLGLGNNRTRITGRWSEPGRLGECLHSLVPGVGRRLGADCQWFRDGRGDAGSRRVGSRPGGDRTDQGVQGSEAGDGGRPHHVRARAGRDPGAARAQRGGQDDDDPDALEHAEADFGPDRVLRQVAGRGPRSDPGAGRVRERLFQAASAPGDRGKPRRLRAALRHAPPGAEGADQRAANAVRGVGPAAADDVRPLGRADDAGDAGQGVPRAAEDRAAGRADGVA